MTWSFITEYTLMSSSSKQQYSGIRVAAGWCVWTNAYFLNSKTSSTSHWIASLQNLRRWPSSLVLRISLTAPLYSTPRHDTVEDFCLNSYIVFYILMDFNKLCEIFRDSAKSKVMNVIPLRSVGFLMPCHFTLCHAMTQRKIFA